MGAMRRIAFYNHTSDVSGAEISLLLTARHLKAARPVIVAPEGELLERARKLGIEVSALPSYRARLTKNPFLLAKDVAGMLAAGWRLSVHLRRSRAELVHANSIRAGLMAGLFAWHHRLPLVWHLRDMPPGGPAGRLIRLLAARTARAFIGISASVLDAFQHPSLDGRLHLVHNGVELRDTPPEAKRRIRAEIRRGLGTPAYAKAAAMIGQIAPWKRQEDAIRAAARLIGEGEDLYLWIVGEPKFRRENELYLASLRRLADELGIAERVVFAGFREDVLDIICAADVMLLCSDNEPFGRVVIEAMSQGTPMIGTAAGGVPEIIEHGSSGLLYPVGDTDALAASMRSVLRDGELSRRLGANGEERARRAFSIGRTAEKVEAVYRHVLADAPPAGRGLAPLGGSAE